MSHVLEHDIETFKRGLELFAKLLSDRHNVRVVHRGQDCYTDGTTIVLPELSLLEKKDMTEEEIASAKKFMTNLQGFVNHEVGHVLFTRFGDMKTLREKFGKQWGKPAGALASYLHNLVEDGRVERLMREQWNNAGFYLDHIWEWLNEGYAERQAKKYVPQNALMHGISTACREGVKSKRLDALPGDVRECLRKLKSVLRQAHKAKTPDDSVKAVEALITKLKEMQPDPPPEKKPKPEEEDEEENDEEDGEGGDDGEEGEEENDEDDNDEDESDEDSEAGEGGDDEDSEEEDDDDSGDDQDGDEEGDSSSEGSGGDGDDGDDGESSETDSTPSKGRGKGAHDDEHSSDDPMPQNGGDGESDSDESRSDPGESDEHGDDHDGKRPEPSDGGGDGDGALSGTATEEETKSAQEIADDLNDMSEQEVEAMEKEASAENQIKEYVKQDLDRIIEKYRVFTNEFDIIQKPPSDPLAARTLENDMMRDAGIVRRRVANVLKARAHVSWLREQEQGKIDMQNLHKLISGRTKAVFKQRQVRQDYKGVSVVIAINLSGSMSAPCGLNMNRMDLAKRAALIMGEVLEGLKIPFEIHGHSCDANRNVLKVGTIDPRIYSRWMSHVVLMVKEFGEQFSVAKQRIPSLKVVGGTYDGETIEFCCKRLLTKPRGTRKIVISFDDGEPCPTLEELIHNKDPNAQYTQAQREEAKRDADAMVARHQKHLVETVNKYEARGIEILGVGMGTGTVKDYYKRSIVLANDKSFAGNLAQELQRVLIQR